MCQDCAYHIFPPHPIGSTEPFIFHGSPTLFDCFFFWRRQRRRDENGVLRIKMYESYAQVTIFLPRDFHGVVGRVGHSGRSIACSHAALYLKESNNLRLNDVPDETDDLVLVRTEKVLRVCVVDDDPPLPPAGRGRSFSE